MERWQQHYQHHGYYFGEQRECNCYGGQSVWYKRGGIASGVYVYRIAGAGGYYRKCNALLRYATDLQRGPGGRRYFL